MKQTQSLRRRPTSIALNDKERELVEKASALSGKTFAEFCRIAATGEAILIINQLNHDSSN